MIGQTVYFRQTAIAGVVLAVRESVRFGREYLVQWENNEPNWQVEADLRFA